MVTASSITFEPLAKRAEPERVLDPQAQTAYGLHVTLMPMYRRGRVEFAVDSLAMSPNTWADLLTEQGTDGPRWRRLEPILRQTSSTAVMTLQAQVIDVSKVGRPTVARPRQGQPMFKDDRVAQLVEGIRHLVGQMADVKQPSPGQLRTFAKRYTELREELTAVRAAVSDAEACFEVIQTQLVSFMEGEP